MNQLKNRKMKKYYSLLERYYQSLEHDTYPHLWGMLNEKLIPVGGTNMSHLNHQMDIDEELKNTLMTKLKDNKNYKGLIPPNDREEYANYTLYKYIKETIKTSGYKSFFIEDKGALTGFMAYMDMGDEVTGIIVFSFDLSKNNVELVRDMIKFVEDMLDKSKTVNWVAMDDNKDAIKIYKKFMDKKEREGYKVITNEDFTDRISYTIKP